MAAFDGSVFLFGGYGKIGGFLGDAWVFNGTMWAQVTAAPAARQEHAMATLNGSVVLFGGYNGSGFLNDTWTLKGTTWTQVNGATPPARFQHAMSTLP
jgi:hypothetical protein